MDYIFKNALEFLVFAYWGITFDEKNSDSILEKIVRKAYKDAAGQGAFNTLIKKGDPVRKDANKAKKEAIKKVKEHLELEGIRGNDYKEWHEKLCEEIQSVFSSVNKEKELWSYGNSQKLVNMSVKYVVLLSSIFNALGEKEKNDDLCKIGRYFTDRISKLDIPVDSYIIEKAAKEELVKIIGKNTPWSKWDQGEYETFENSLKDYVKNQTEFENPFDWESHAWIEIAKERRKKDDSDKDQE